ncbi:MAG: TonB family protein [Arenimonas sp.]
MRKCHRHLALVLGMASVFAPALLAAPTPAAQRPQAVALRVGVDAAGMVQSANVLDPATSPAIAQAAQEIARKLQFQPARTSGRAVASETTLTLVLALVPRGEGFGIALRRAQNGPSVKVMGKANPPRVGRDNGGLVMVSVDLDAQGAPVMASFKVEKVELRVPSTFAEERFVNAAKLSLKSTQFQLDKVDGIETPARITVPFQFNGGAARPKQGEDELKPEQVARDAAPSLTETSSIPEIELPKIDYIAPAQ